MQEHTPEFPSNITDYAPWVATHGLLAPYGKCQCGCGADAPITDQSDAKKGWGKDQPARFISQHHARVQNRGSFAERFWAKVDRNGPIHPVLQTACWLWTGARLVSGYGVFTSGPRKSHEFKRAHRVAYSLTYGFIPEGMEVCHRCDNPPCCNPSHLFAGSHQDNVDDMVSKGRNRNAKRISYQDA